MKKTLLLLVAFSLITAKASLPQNIKATFLSDDISYILNHSNKQTQSAIEFQNKSDFDGFFESFEDYQDELPSDWQIKRSTSLTGTLESASSPMWFLCKPSSFNGTGSNYIHTGLRSAAISHLASNFTWLISKEITMPEETKDLNFWLYYHNMPAQGQFTYFHVMVKETSDDNWTNLKSWDYEDSSNQFDELVTISLASFESKDIQVAFVYENIENNGIQVAIDNILIGTFDSHNLNLSPYHFPYSSVPAKLVNTLDYELNVFVSNYGLNYDDNSTSVAVSIPLADNFQSLVELQDEIETGETKFVTFPQKPTFSDINSYNIEFNLVINGDGGNNGGKTTNTTSFKFKVSDNTFSTDFSDDYGIAGGVSVGMNKPYGNIYPVKKGLVVSAIEIGWPEFEYSNTFYGQIYEISPVDSSLTLVYEKQLNKQIAHSDQIVEYEIDPIYLEPGANYFVAAKQTTTTLLNVGFDRVHNGQFWRLNNGELELISTPSLGNLAVRLKIDDPNETPTFTLSVTDGSDPLENASVNLNGNVEQTNADGIASFELPNGYYEFTVEKDGFISEYKEVLIRYTDVDMSLTLRPAFEVTFNVENDDEEELENVEILIFNKVLTTNSDGQATVMLPTGNHEFSVMLSGYSPYYNSISVSEDSTYEIVLTPAETFDVTFNLVARHNEQPLESARVLLFGYGAKYTNSNGTVVFSVLESNDTGIQYELSKKGYLIASGTTIHITEENDPVTVEDTLDIVTYDVTIQVTDGTSPLLEASVTLGSHETVLTDENGYVQFHNVIPSPSINLVATKEGYKNKQTQIGVYNANIRSSIELEIDDETSSPTTLSGGIVVYPNPSNGIFNINGEGIFKVDVFDLNGRLVYSQQNAQSEHTIDISQYATGIYLVRIISDKNIITRRIIKQ